MNKKIIALFFVGIFLFSMSFCLSGCFSGLVGVYVEESPQKIIYKAGESIDFSGIKLKGINADGTLKRVKVTKKNIEEEPDFSTKGEKTIVLNIDSNRTSFTVYVPHFVVTPFDDLKQIVLKAQSGDIIYLTKGDYKNTNDNLEKYKDIIIEKSLIFIGDKNQTVFGGNFKLKLNSEEINKNKGVQFYNIKFEIDNTLNNIVSAIEEENSNSLYVKNCEFEGYSYAINLKNAQYLSVIKNKFRNIKITAIKTEKSTQNTTVYKNSFMDICENTLYLDENGKQNYMAAIDFAFNSEQNSGVIISNNSFTRIGLKTGDFEPVGAYKSQENLNEKELKKLSYVNNTAIIILRSSSNSNLKTRGIILSNNSYGTTLNNIIFGTSENDFLNESAVIINNN